MKQLDDYAFEGLYAPRLIFTTCLELPNLPLPGLNQLTKTLSSYLRMGREGKGGAVNTLYFKTKCIIKQWDIKQGLELIGVHSN